MWDLEPHRTVIIQAVLITSYATEYVALWESDFSETLNNNTCTIGRLPVNFGSPLTAFSLDYLPISTSGRTQFSSLPTLLHQNILSNFKDTSWFPPLVFWSTYWTSWIPVTNCFRESYLSPHYLSFLTFASELNL